MVASLEKFGLDPKDINRYRLVEVSLEKGGMLCITLGDCFTHLISANCCHMTLLAVHERTMDNQECPWEIIKNIARDSVRRKENTRFYLQTKDDVYCSNVAIFVGNLPCNLQEKQYERILVDLLGKREF